MSPRHQRLVKRALDITLSFLSLIVLTPVLVLVALGSLVAQGTPLLYVSKRYVAVNRAVSIYKFRTMVRDATSEKYGLKRRYMRDGYLDIPSNSEVYTPFGHLLERTQIVEVPQILNVLLDGLSWVGNRALPKENIELLNKFDGWEERFDCPCGLTGVSQIVGKGKMTPRQRITLERYYAKVYKDGDVLKADFLIVLATIRLVLLGRPSSYEETAQMLQGCLGRPVHERTAS